MVRKVKLSKIRPSKIPETSDDFCEKESLKYTIPSGEFSISNSPKNSKSPTRE